MMNQPDDQWSVTLQRGVASLDFQVTRDPTIGTPVMTGAPGDLRGARALVQAAALAAAEADRWVAAGAGDIPIPRDLVLTRRDLANAKAAEPPGSVTSPFTAGYAAVYRLELSRLLWAAISDAPARRLEELARRVAS
ncbi:hypothetical protein [Caulobacter endophyticus]|uniref:hypothetical protein n=1 Tax=Caulobacter endophyticus TaxID=2172652 RepID=UPI00240ED333|nr:hypothetical protein [Caulobacter endophyticus]MDG2529454.1 hypothetical protein [Caulobacter endophyticus]